MTSLAKRGRLLAVLAGALVPALLSPPAAAAEMDDHIYTFFQLDQNEYRLNDEGEDLYAWDAQGWVGTDYDKLFLKSEGEYVLEGEWREGGSPGSRSEEHTSELQSLMRISYAVFCLKKKNHKCKSQRSTCTHCKHYYI